MLVFYRTKSGVEKLSGMLVGKGIKAESIHGNKITSNASGLLGKFKENRAQVLVATDVVARRVWTLPTSAMSSITIFRKHTTIMCTASTEPDAATSKAKRLPL